MSREDYEVFKLLKHESQKEGAKRREESSNDFGAASQLAHQAGMVLIRHSEVHYQLRGQLGWLINIYPGNCRLYHDRNKPKPPYLNVSPGWTLLDVVRAAIAASNNTDSFAEEISKKAQPVLNEFFIQKRIEKRAYYLWEEAGCPIGDGKEFWYQAEKELRGQ